jgi:hypothetical protein
MTMDERMTLCNMTVEAGATSGICLPDMTTVDYLWPFIGDEFKGNKNDALKAFSRWRSDDDAVYEKTITLDVSGLEPLSTVGYKPDQVKKIKDLSDVKIDQVYIGSCTNGRLDDLRIAASIVKGTRLARGDTAHFQTSGGGRHHRHVHGRRLLRDQSDLRGVPGNVQRRPRRRRNLRLDHQPQFLRPHGKRRHGAPDEPGVGRSERKNRTLDGSEGIFEVMKHREGRCVQPPSIKKGKNHANIRRTGAVSGQIGHQYRRNHSGEISERGVQG